MHVVSLRRRGLQVLVSLVMTAVVSVLFAVPSRAADAPAPPSVSSSDWAKWKAQLSSRTQAARMPLRSIAAKIGGSTNSVTAARSRAAVVAKSVAESRAKSNAAFGRVAVPTTAKNVATKVGAKTLGAGGKALSAVLVFNLTYELGTSAMSGMFGLESDGFMCDMRSVFGQADCGLGPQIGYIANSDVGAIITPGWTAQPVVDAYWRGCRTGPTGSCQGSPNTQIQALIVDMEAPAFGSAGTLYPRVSAPGNPNGLWSWFLEGTPDGQKGFVELIVVDSAGVGGVASSGSLFKAGQVLMPGAPVPVETINLANRWDHAVLRQLVNGVRVDIATWYPEGHALRPADVVENPIRFWQTTWKCSVGGGATVTESATSAQFSELDETWPEFPDAACSSGDLVEFHVDQISEGMEPLRVYEWVLPEEAAAWAAEYPQCADGSCTLELERIDTTTGAWLACFDSPDLCTNWFADPAKTENYRCTYGGDTLALDECTMYAPTFTKELGGGLGDPLTGEKVDTSKTGPGTAPTDPTITNPGGSLWGTSSRPGNCPPPFEWNSVVNPWWYYQGVKCALYEAFVPAEPSAPFIALQAYWNTTRIGMMFASWNGVFDNLRVGAANCKGPGGHFSTASFGIGGVDFYPMNSCTGWGAEWAPRVKSLATWFTGFMASYGMLKTVARGFGHEMDER